MISIITPTHNTAYLNELQDSILAQTFTDWEWIVVVNHGAKFSSIDRRIKVIEFPFNSDSVGMLKKYACMQSSGDIIVEVDHDDLITPDCLQEVCNAFVDPSVGFVYSDNAKLADNFIPYDEYQGWSYSKYIFRNRELFAMHSQPAYPGRLGYIWYAPDHVRAWRKSVYDSVGGHNDALSICDDQDLMHKLYMVTKFHHINKVLYIYRITGNNTWLNKNQSIQENTVSIYNNNIFSLSDRFADVNGLLKLDIGGFNKRDGYLSIGKEYGDILVSLEEKLPFKDNSVGVVVANDALCSVKNVKLLMTEIHRVLAPGGMLLSKTPSTDGRGAWQDPTHQSFWNQNSFWYWTRPQQAYYISNTKLFRECKLVTEFPDDYCRENNISYVIAHLEKLM